MLSPLTGLRRRTRPPFARIPQGRMVERPGRGSTYVTDTPGPSPRSPTIVLLHALGCTGPLSRRFRVVTLDLRCHGRGIQGEQFSLVDCADDVGALVDVLELEDVLIAGYSMGSIVAQRVWRQHGSRVSGLVLCATTDRFQMTVPERAFFTGMGATMLGLRSISRSRAAVHVSRAAARAPTSSRRTSRRERWPSSDRPHRGRWPRPSPRWAVTTRGRGWAGSTYRPRSSSTAATT
jgi:3-oxoadipate enol-lactonase